MLQFLSLDVEGKFIAIFPLKVVEILNYVVQLLFYDIIE